MLLSRSYLCYLCCRYSIEVERVHTHIGSGSDPLVWQGVAGASIALVDLFPTGRRCTGTTHVGHDLCVLFD